MERLTGWHKLQNFDDEDVYYLQAEISIPLNGDAKRDIETTLREQIAREIMDKCKNEKETNTSEFGSYEVVGCLEFIQLEDTAYYEVTCTHAEDAAIARGK